MNRVAVCSSLVLLMALGGCVSSGQSKPLPPGVLQKGTLANQQLIRDTMAGVAGKAATLGCMKIDSWVPYVLALPQGAPGSRVWRERWIVDCSGTTYPIDIRFNESGMGAADYTIR